MVPRILILLSAQICMLFGIKILLLCPPQTGILRKLNLTKPENLNPVVFTMECLMGVAIIMVVNLVIQIIAALAGITLPPTVDMLLLKNQPLPALLAVAFSALCIAPLAEEILIRKFTFDGFLMLMTYKIDITHDPRLRFIFMGLACIAASGFFALLHLDLVKFFPLFFFGCYLQYLRYKYQSLIPSVIAHAFNNVVAVLMLTLLYFYNAGS